MGHSTFPPHEPITIPVPFWEGVDLEAEVCCGSETSAARAFCGCKGAAATELRLIREQAANQEQA